jgi:hypothetical protein
VVAARQPHGSNNRQTRRAPQPEGQRIRCSPNHQQAAATVCAHGLPLVGHAPCGKPYTPSIGTTQGGPAQPYARRSAMNASHQAPVPALFTTVNGISDAPHTYIAVLEHARERCPASGWFPDNHGAFAVCSKIRPVHASIKADGGQQHPHLPGACFGHFNDLCSSRAGVGLQVRL